MPGISKRFAQVLWLTAISLLACLLVGCGNAIGGSDAPEHPQLDLSPEQIVRHMISAYQNATTYEDEGILRIEYRHAGEIVSGKENLRVACARPNRLHVEAYNVELASDGESLRYRVVDELSGDMDRQFVERPAPRRIDWDELVERDPILNHFVSGGAGPPIQLELLFSAKPLEAFFQNEAEWKQLDSDRFDGHACHRIQVETVHGEFVLWIDAEQFLLRKFEYPAENFLTELASIDGVSDVQLAAEFHGARVDRSCRNGFGISKPRETKRVQYFVTLPPPLPTDMFGRRPRSFYFADLEGRRIGQSDLDGTLAVLVWFGNQPASQVNLQKLDAVRDAVTDQRGVKFLAVCTEPTTLASHEDVANLVSSWSVKVPVVRDLEPVGQEVFGITNLPTLIVLDRQGKVQYFEVLEQPHLEDVLPVVIQRLLGGDDLAAEILGEYQAELDRYQRELAVARATDQGHQKLETPNGDRTEIKRTASAFALERLWTCDELAAPGNILVAAGDRSGKQEILVVDGWRSIAVLDIQGRVTQRFPLDLPERSAVTYLRTSTDGQGSRWYVATEILAKQLHVFDAEWNRVFSFPRTNQTHGGIRDVQLADPDGDGEPEVYAAFWEQLGVQQVSLDGKRLGENQSVPRVVSIATTDGAERHGAERRGSRSKLLATDGEGSIVPMDALLNSRPPLTVEGHPIEMVFSASVDGTESGLCGVYHTSESNFVAVGLDAKYQPTWTARLPAGVFNSQIQFVCAGRVDGYDGWQWLIARPDGSIHLISNDGQLKDSVEFNSSLTGLALTKQSVLLVATENGITAWKIRINSVAAEVNFDPPTL